MKSRNKRKKNTMAQKFEEKQVDSNSSVFKWIFAIILIAILVCGTLYFSQLKRIVNKEIENGETYISNNSIVTEVKIDVDYLAGKIKNLSDLITAELDYTGVVNYENYKKIDVAVVGDIAKSLTTDNFLLEFSAQIKAGIDLSTVDIKEYDDTILVKIPHAEIKTIDIDNESIKIHEIKKGFINIINNRDEVREALVMAETHVKKNANLTKLLNSAEKQAKLIIENFIKDLVNGKKIDIIFN